MGRVQKFPNLLIYSFLCLFKFIIISFLVSRGRKISRLSPSDRNTRKLAFVSSFKYFLAFFYFTCACFSELFVVEGFLKAFFLLNNLCWKS